jgi:4'-phosphopantetheinyl transferase
LTSGPRFLDPAPISDNEVHIWWMQVPAVTSHTMAPYVYLLDPDERLTYSRYKIDEKKVEFLSGRCLAKTLLGAYIGVAPSLVHFNKNSYGKPFLANAKKKLAFNISHSHRLIVCAISSNEITGVDVEKADQEHDNVMPLVFQHQEIEWVEKQPDPFSKLSAFYTLWTRKEAVMKAVGKGFSLPPLSFRVPVDSHTTHNDDFDFYTFEPLPQYITTVATRRLTHTQVSYRIQEVKFPQLLPMVSGDVSL